MLENILREFMRIHDSCPTKYLLKLFATKKSAKNLTRKKNISVYGTLTLVTLVFGR